MKLTETPEWYNTHNAEVLESLTATNAMIADGAMCIRVPKTVARVTLCGALTFNIDDTMKFTKPTPEQIKNLKETFCIDVKLFEEE